MEVRHSLNVGDLTRDVCGDMLDNQKLLLLGKAVAFLLQVLEEVESPPQLGIVGNVVSDLKCLSS